MNNSFLQHLRPMERRIVIGAAIIVFIVINVVWVRPHFKDWSRVQLEFANARTALAKYKTEIARRSEYEKQQKSLEETSGGGLLPEEMAVQLRRIIQNQATQSGFVPTINELPRRQTMADKFFDEQSVRVSYIAGEPELVDFLYNISKDRSMIRVKDLTVRPDGALQKLQGEITLTASYQKKTAARAVPGTGTKTVVPPKTTTPPAKPAPAKSAPPKSPKPSSADVEK